MGGTHNSLSVGKNSIIRNSNTTGDYFIYSPSVSSNLTDVKSLDENYWGTGIGDGSQTLIGNTAPDALLPGLTYNSNPIQQSATPFIDPTTENCSDGLNPNNDIIRRKNIEPFSNIEMDTLSECTQLFNRGNDYYTTSKPESLKIAYVIFKQFIEKCAGQKSVDPVGPPRVVFGALDGCVPTMDTTNIRWIEYREWLKKVLYYSTDSNYYCQDISSMFTTFNYFTPGRGIDYNGEAAVVDYLLKTARCPEQMNSFLEGRAYLRERQVTIWRDTVKDTLKTPLDTSAVSIDSIGFSILRGPQFGAVRPSSIRNGIGLSELKANRNPFKDETTLQAHIEDATVLKLEIIDLLGKSLYSESKFFIAGDIQWVLDGKALPEGSFYVRLSTHEGSVQTIKLIKE